MTFVDDGERNRAERCPRNAGGDVSGEVWISVARETRTRTLPARRDATRRVTELDNRANATGTRLSRPVEFWADSAGRKVGHSASKMQTWAPVEI
jgi:hypothetical protein